MNSACCVQAKIDPSFTVVAKTAQSWRQRDKSASDPGGNVPDSNNTGQDTDTTSHTNEVQNSAIMKEQSPSSDGSEKETSPGSTSVPLTKVDSFPAAEKKQKLDSAKTRSTTSHAVDREKKRKKKQALRLVEDICR